MNPLRILLTNDDGVNSPGLMALAEALRSLPEVEVFVVAPAEEWSARGHAITIREPIYVDRLEGDAYRVPTWRVAGTPADCVKLGLHALLDGPIDLVISGINLGYNLSTDVFYSGTVAAAMEAVLAGIPAMAVSTGITEGVMEDFRFTADFTGALLQLMNVRFDGPWLLNVNVPAVPPADIRGVRVTELGPCPYDDVIHAHQDPHGRHCFWLTIEERDDLTGEDTDWLAIKHQAISLTPLEFLRITHERLQAALKPLTPQLEALIVEKGRD